MSKLEQVLQIEPQSELRFKGPFNVPVTSFMKLTNPSDKRVMFKIKTTAPKKYCVRPNSGILEANSTIEIAICLQPFIFDAAEKNKHKFMVQTVYAPDGDVNLDQFWREIAPESLMDSKLKCVFELPPDSNETQEETAKTAPKATAPPAVSNATDHAELVKAAQEVQQLREEQSMLRQENLRLREEILQLQQKTGGVQLPATARKYSPPAPQQQLSPFSIALVIAFALVGVVLGKFIL